MAAAAQMATALGKQTGIKASAQPGSKTKDSKYQKMSNTLHVTM